MKTTKLLHCLVAISIALFCSCNKQDVTVIDSNLIEDLKKVKSEQLNSSLEDFDLLKGSNITELRAKIVQTKSLSEYSEIDLPKEIIYYIDIYTNKFSSYNIEDDIIECIVLDKKLNYSEKLIVAKILGGGEALKVFVNNNSFTKSTKAECDAAYTLALSRISRNFAITGAVGLIFGGVGLLVATTMAYVALDDAEVDYNRCLKNG